MQDGLLLGAAFEREGFAVDHFDFETEPQLDLVSVTKRRRPDIVFVTKGQGLDRTTYEKLRPFVGKLVMWYPDAYVPEDLGYGVEFLADVLPIFDTVLVCYRGLVNALSKYNPNCHFGPHYFDNHFYAVDNLTSDDWGYFSCDAVFIGNNQKVYGQERVRALRAAAKVCSLKIWGTGWGFPLTRTLANVGKLGSRGNIPPTAIRTRLWRRLLTTQPAFRMTRFSKAVMARELLDNSVSKAYQCSKMGLNAGSLAKLGRSDIDLGFSDRLYKCMGNSTPYLTPPIRNIEEWFSPDKEIAIYRSKEELTAWIQYLLDNEAERLEMGRNGLSKIARFHTIDIRIKQYLVLIDGGVCPFDCKHDS